MKTVFKAALAASIATAALGTATQASAAVEIKQTGGFVSPDENVLATTNMTGIKVMGTTNQTNTSVTVESLNGEFINSSDSNGQAKFNTSDGSLDTAVIYLTNGGSFLLAELNLFKVVDSTSSVQIFVNNVLQGSYTIGGGNNTFGFKADAGTPITSIKFDTNGTGVVDLRQVRLGGIAAVTAVPEPGTWALMLVGFGAVGFSMRRRRRATALLQMA